MLRHLMFALSGALIVCVSGAYAQTFTTLHTFENTDGANPGSALVEDGAGNLYSTTTYGGDYQNGTAFQLKPSGALTVLHHFGYPSSDGYIPSSALLPFGQGNFYGTTYNGGIFACGPYNENQCGTVFQVNAAGKESVVYSFGSKPNDGTNPTGGLIRGSDGNFYGTTGYGGDNHDGVVYQLTSSGVETVIYAFKGGMDGVAPNGPLVMDAHGDLWGTTSEGGGSSTCGFSGQVLGCGTVFHLRKTKAGWTETVTYRFSGGADGAQPSALVFDRAKDAFYGVTNYGGSASGCIVYGNITGCGTVFKLDAKGSKESVLHDFSGRADGGEPVANLVLDSRGDLYGTTTLGGDMSCPAGYSGCGTVFILGARGQFATIHTFTGGADGAVPLGALLVDQRHRALYGTASDGGDPNCQTPEGGGPGCGVVFRITP